MHSSPLPVGAAYRGFTLIEIMVVVVILGLLATLVVPAVMEHGETAKQEKAGADVHTIAGAVRLYFVQHGRLPELPELVQRDAKGRTFLEALPRDPWQNDYVLRAGDEPQAFEVVSAGGDRTLGTPDDVSSRAPQ